MIVRQSDAPATAPTLTYIWLALTSAKNVTQRCQHNASDVMWIAINNRGNHHEGRQGAFLLRTSPAMFGGRPIGCLGFPHGAQRCQVKSINSLLKHFQKLLNTVNSCGRCREGGRGCSVPSAVTNCDGVSSRTPRVANTLCWQTPYAPSLGLS